VLFDTGCDGKDIRVENDVLRREADLIDQQAVGARANFHLSGPGVGLAMLVEGHHHDGGAVAQDLARLVEELRFTFLERNRIDDPLALQALQPGFDHAPFGAVDHHRNACDVGLGGNQIEIGHHRRFGVEHALVHVDIEDLRAVFDLLTGDCHRLVVAAFDDQPAKLRRASDIGPLADVDEVGLRSDDEWFETGKSGASRELGHVGVIP